MEYLDQRQNAPHLTCSWRAIGALVAFAIVLALFARGAGTLWIDAQATELVQGLDGSAYSTAADAGNALGESRYAVTLVTILGVLTTITKRWRELIFLVLLLVLRAVGTVMKGMFDSPRPTSEVAEIVHAFDGLGFPSGHSMTSSVAVGGIVFLALRWKDSLSMRRSLAAIWLLCVGLTAFARVWVGAHWLSDTIGGTMMGAAIVLISANLSTLGETLLMSSQGRARGSEATREPPVPQDRGL